MEIIIKNLNKEKLIISDEEIEQLHITEVEISIADKSIYVSLDELISAVDAFKIKRMEDNHSQSMMTMTK